MKYAAYAVHAPFTACKKTAILINSPIRPMIIRECVVYSDYHFDHSGDTIIIVASYWTNGTYAGCFNNGTLSTIEHTDNWGSLNDHLREGWYYYYTGNDWGSHECGLFAVHTDNTTHGYYAGSPLTALSSRIYR